MNSLMGEPFFEAAGSFSWSQGRCKQLLTQLQPGVRTTALQPILEKHTLLVSGSLKKDQYLLLLF